MLTKTIKMVAVALAMVGSATAGSAPRAMSDVEKELPQDAEFITSGADDLLVLVLTTTLKRQDAFASAWIMFVPMGPTKIFQDDRKSPLYTQAKLKYEVTCAGDRLNVSSTVYYNGPKTVTAHSDLPARWAEVVPGSVGEAILRRLCRD